MAYTVKEIAGLAGVSVRTLHFYDEIGLLRPARVNDKGYRYYEGEQVLRLQQILFYRDMDMPLSEIQAVMILHADQTRVCRSGLAVCGTRRLSQIV